MGRLAIIENFAWLQNFHLYIPMFITTIQNEDVLFFAVNIFSKVTYLLIDFCCH